MEKVKFKQMKDGTKEEYLLLDKHEKQYIDGTADRLINFMSGLNNTLEGYQITRLEHSLQTATRALNDKADDEMIVAALFHDVGDPIAPANHSAVAAEILKPYVDDRIFWIIRHHGVFQGYYYFHHLGGDRDARDIFREHEWFDDCVYFCHEYDQNCFDPNYNEMPLEEFTPLVYEVFNRPSRFEGFELA